MPRISYQSASIAMSLISVMAMGLVICHHLPTHQQGGILEWGVPWFYFASGFWYASKPRKFRGEMAKRIQTLLVPYFLLNAIWFPILFFANWIGWKYLGVDRVVDGSVPSIVRCLGLCPWAWPALVPTWFLRSLFVAVFLVAGVWAAFGSMLRNGRKARIAVQASVALVMWSVVLTRHSWCSTDGHWADFFVFGVPLHGMACFALGGLVSTLIDVEGCVSVPALAATIRRQVMPVYVLHAVVIVACGWIARAAGCYDKLLTLPGDVVMWFVGVVGAIFLGEIMRRNMSKFAGLVFGGR